MTLDDQVKKACEEAVAAARTIRALHDVGGAPLISLSAHETPVACPHGRPAHCPLDVDKEAHVNEVVTASRKIVQLSRVAILKLRGRAHGNTEATG